MKTLPIILASASPRRVDLLRAMGLKFTVIPGGVPELHDDQLTAAEVAQLNAFRKARSIAVKNPDSLVIGADTLVYLEGKLFGKPATIAEAHKMLKRLSGKTHHVVTAVCLMQVKGGRCKVFAEMTDVQFRSLGDAEIKAYIESINPLDKAGGYAIQERGDKIVAEISGSFNNVVGLPTERLEVELRVFAEGGSKKDLKPAKTPARKKPAGSTALVHS